MIYRLLKFTKYSILTLVIFVILLLLPVVYVETFCRHDPSEPTYNSIIKDEKWLRTEANSYLTYPEWHIVYAYEGLAKILEKNDEHGFDYFESIRGFWLSFCSLNKVANKHGGGDFNTRGTVHTIGVSFTLEMVMKALYEETIGRLFAIFRGNQKSPQDIYSAQMAADYANFLQQVPWYKYDFDKATAQLWENPTSSFLRGWVRRLALGGEWKEKASYAQVIAKAVEAAGQAPLRIRSVISNISLYNLKAIEGIDVIEQTGQSIIIETPRYRKFTRILQKLTKANAVINEIAGNDDIMLSSVGNPKSKVFQPKNAILISRLTRDGYDSERFLLSLKVNNLNYVLEELYSEGLEIEHIYDY